KDNNGLGYGLDRSMNLWVHGRDILLDIFGHNSLHEFHILACHHSCRFNGVIGIDVVSIGGNNGVRFGVLRILQEIKFEKELVLEAFESFIRSVVEEDSSNIKNSLCWTV
nr:hypothetical protein [Tanacetum cinerariifolium]